MRKSSWRQRSFASQERSAQSSTTCLGAEPRLVELGDVSEDMEEAVEMSVVEAQTLFAADAPQHAPTQPQWRGVRGQGIRGYD